MHVYRFIVSGKSLWNKAHLISAWASQENTPGKALTNLEAAQVAQGNDDRVG